MKKRTAEWRDSYVRLIPPKAHPLAQDLFRAMRDERITYGDMNEASGVSFWTIIAWRQGRAPDLQNLAACLAVAKLRLCVRRAA